MSREGGCPHCGERVVMFRDRLALVRRGGGPVRKNCPGCHERVELQLGGRAGRLSRAARRLRGLDPVPGGLLGVVACFLLAYALVLLADRAGLGSGFLPLSVLLATFALTLLLALLASVRVRPAAGRESAAELLAESHRDLADQRRGW